MSSSPFHGPRRWISSVLNNPITVSAPTTLVGGLWNPRGHEVAVSWGMGRIPEDAEAREPRYRRSTRGQSSITPLKENSHIATVVLGHRVLVKILPSALANFLNVRDKGRRGLHRT